MSESKPFQVLPLSDHVNVPNDVAVWSQMDYDILQTLAIRLRVMSLNQMFQVWNRCKPTLLTQCLDQLAEAALVQRFVVNAHPPLQPKAPLCAWWPEAPEPDFRLVSDLARSRWDQPAVPTDVVVASKQTANLFGGGSQGLPPVDHLDHDLLLADVFAIYRENRTDESRHWVSEDFLPKAGFQIKDPDAFLLDDAGHPTRVIESAGKYSAKQCESFHDHCESQDLPYELW